MGNVILVGAGIFLFFFLKKPAARFAAWIARGLARRFVHPVEGWLLQKLQDRATARAFGTSVDVVKIRRRADGVEP